MKRIGKVFDKILVFVLVLVLSCSYNETAAQDAKVYDSYSDTLLVLGDLLVNKDKILINREDFLNIDSLLVNQKGFVVNGFKMNALALGVNVVLESNSSVISTEMKNEIVNEQTKYKFIYLKDILLLSGDGKKCSPSTRSIKIVFKN